MFRAGYTRNVGSKVRTIGFAMLAVLCLLPVSGTLCAIACNGAEQSSHASHHHGAAHEAGASGASHDLQIAGSSYPCNHVAAVQQATKAPDRVEFAGAPHAATVTHEWFSAQRPQELRPPRGAPPGSPPSNSTVLRI